MKRITLAVKNSFFHSQFCFIGVKVCRASLQHGQALGGHAAQFLVASLFGASNILSAGGWAFTVDIAAVPLQAELLLALW